MRLVHHGPHLLEAVLTGQDVSACGHDPAACHDLDDIGAALGAQPHGAAKLIAAVSLATKVRAMAAPGGDRRSRSHDGRAQVAGRASGPALPPGQYCEVPVAEVPHGGNAP